MKRNYIRNRYIFILDFLSILFASLLTYFVVYAGMDDISWGIILTTGGMYGVWTFVFFVLFRVYRTAWCYSGSAEIVRFLLVNLAAIVVMYISNEVLLNMNFVIQAHRRVIFAIAVMSVLAMTIVRMVSKEMHKSVGYKKMNSKSEVRTDAFRVLVIGAGDAGRIIVNNINQCNSDYNIIGLIDDDKSKHNKYFYDKKVLGGREDIIRICRQMEIDKIILAIPTAYADDRKEIIDICRKTKCDIKTIPGISEILDFPENENLIRDIKIEDLLERDAVKLDTNGINELVSGKVIMVTGGGGSIGSELCRQIMRFLPKKLIIVDIYENNAYDIQMELNEKYPDNKPVVLIASIRDKKRLEEIFTVHRPQIVFHAAAHKHVPLMEASPKEAVKNNVFGTYNLALTADKFGVEKFVMISTDKAVNPTNVMGASKRFCEMIIQCMEKVSETDFVAVRFGNVLGSNGSVIPLFKRQIESGGPVRVTHRDVTRFFMTIPEAAQLVIQAACFANGGEIFVLDMGSPVKIYDLAENLIRLSGHTPGEDIKIEITGLRPGEKLYEELLMDTEGLEKTRHNKIFVGRPGTVELDELKSALDMLVKAIEMDDENAIRDAFEKTVPTYIRDNVAFNKAYEKVKTEVHK
ncbi:MAG: polysaccharide biosynthesis protein [Clostridia bacterium]|nr:polysaccharide biosynthesis protein [Clostridia bacterium]